MSSKKLSETDTALGYANNEILKMGVSFVFLVSVLGYVLMQMQGIPGGFTLAISAAIGGYMAMNIGANDVANNVGPAVGSKALTLIGAIAIAAIFEAAGALIAGGDVVSTIKKGIIDPSAINDSTTFIALMLAALFAGALWLNLATFVGAPVSTTHSIVGGVLGAGIAAGGFAIANWGQMSAIAASWVISPVLGGLIAAGFQLYIKRNIMHSENMLQAAKSYVPVLLAIMAWSFSTYLALKGLKKIFPMSFVDASILGAVIAIFVYFLSRKAVDKASKKNKNNRDGVNNLFTIPLIFAAALLSFAHGANDVANAVGPLAAIADAIQNHGVSAKAAIPLWVMIVGAVGIALGLLLFGPKLIRTVGTEITDIDKSRAFCVALAASITVIIASQLGLPVSSTHIAVGGVFGVGFLREYLRFNSAVKLHKIAEQHEGKERQRLEKFLEDFQNADLKEMEDLIKEAKAKKEKLGINKKDRKRLKSVYKEQLVKRSAIKKIVTAWIVTVPCSAALAASIFFLIRPWISV
ncbi:MAG: inorganic phosphate transporter [Oleiphilaceae bacterium]|nr:inorganic phosphate transporter [Oleiphilaceae bacterium]